MSLIKSFKNAWNGILYCLRHERNFRIHVVAACYVLYLSGYYPFSKWEYIVLAIVFAMMLSAEMINTAIEQFIDIRVDHFDFHAKMAKDIAAGAVCVCAVFSAVVGCALFWDVAVLQSIGQKLLAEPLHTISLLLSVVLAVLFVKFGLGKEKTV